MKKNNKTIVVNLFGAPGSGKSTGAAYIFYRLKSAGVNAELITEFAKDKTWEKNTVALDNQPYVFGQQAYRMGRCADEVDVIVTDSPLPLSIVYNSNKKIAKSFNKTVMEVFNSYENINFLITRNKDYCQTGRVQTENESNKIQSEIERTLNEEGVGYLSGIYGDEYGYEIIVQSVFQALEDIGTAVSRRKCNLCGTTYDTWDDLENFSITKKLGFGTKYDGSNLDLHLCCECLQNLVDICAISPIHEDETHTYKGD